MHICMCALSTALADWRAPTQMGATLVLGTAFISLLYPVKIGFVGYVMILYAMLKHGLTPSPPALLFTFLFLIATRVLSMFNSVAEARAAKRADAAQASRQSALATAKPRPVAAAGGEGPVGDRTGGAQRRAAAKRTD